MGGASLKMLSSSESKLRSLQTIYNAEAWWREFEVPCMFWDLRILERSSTRFIFHLHELERSAFLDWLDQKLLKYDAVGHHKPLGYATALKGWRDPYSGDSAQIILHFDSKRDLYFFEMDFDRWNPAAGAAPAFLHFFTELLVHKTTGRKMNSLRMAKRLRKKREWVIRDAQEESA